MLKINCINLCYFKLLKFTKKKIDVLASTLKKFKTKEQMKNEMMPLYYTYLVQKIIL